MKDAKASVGCWWWRVAGFDAASCYVAWTRTENQQLCCVRALHHEKQDLLLEECGALPCYFDSSRADQWPDLLTVEEESLVVL